VVGEVDGVLALFGDRHGGGEEVELAGVQRGNDAIPVGGHHFAFHFHLGAQRVGDIQVETDGRAAGIDQVEGRVGAFGADAQFLRSECLGADDQGCSSGQQNLLIAFHAVLLH